MSSFQFFQYFQIFFSLIVAALLTYRLRKPIRAVIVQMMPVRKRVSDEFFHIQTRIGAIVGFIIAVVIAGLIYFALEPLKQPFRKKTVQESFTPIVPVKRFPVKKEPVESSSDTIQPKNEQKFSSGETGSEKEEEQEALTSYDEVTKKAPATASIPEYGDWYLQVNAFDLYENAGRELANYQQKLSRSVWLAVANGRAPYKVLIGPFPDRQFVLQYKRQHRLTGWPRTKEGLRFEAGGVLR